jgi:4-hydroxyphenylpyruvate dioxygenase
MAQITEQNPVGIDGVDFIEYSGPDAQALEILFARMGFKEVSDIPNRQIKLFRQGNINFILNTEPKTFATEFAKTHGPSIVSTGWKVVDAEYAQKAAVSRGARPYVGSEAEKGATPFPAVYGIGDSLIYFVDAKGLQKLYNEIFEISSDDKAPRGVGLIEVDHFTNNVPKGEMQKWCDFYEKVFNFRETRYFDIKGKQTGLFSKVMRSPCGKFSVPINEPTGSKSQIQEYLDEYKGSGIQHLALTTGNIIDTLETMKTSQIEFLSPPPTTYYGMMKDRLPNVMEDLSRLETNAILVDGDHDGYLLQIFTKNVIGPIFYELIQRKNHFGFGEGNFQALFDAIERDQKARGYL